MIVWVSSFPRSGNTFLRIIMNRLYGVRTSVVYDRDGVAERLGDDLVGYEDRPATYDAMRASPDPHFVKTHRRRDDLVDDDDKAVCLVRDGRDSLVSWARLTSEKDSSMFATELRAMIDREADVGTGSWGHNVLSWLQPAVPHRVMLRYEDLTREPRASVERVVTALLPDLRPRGDAAIPTFADLQHVDGAFFRRGRSGTHQDELPDDLHELFWSKADNAAAMALLGHRGPETAAGNVRT